MPHLRQNSLAALITSQYERMQHKPPFFYDPNKQEVQLNTLTSQLTSDPSKRLAIAKSLNFRTENLIIGGQRDRGGGDAPRGTATTTSENRVIGSGGGSRFGSTSGLTRFEKLQLQQQETRRRGGGSGAR